MDNLLLQTLDELKQAKIQVFPKTIRKQINLFDFESGPEINFNGFKSTSEYQLHLDKLFYACKKNASEIFEETCQQAFQIKRRMDLHRIEVQEFKNRYFPRQNDIVLFNRIEFVKTIRADIIDDTGLKKKILDFFTIQSQLVDLLYQLYLCRIQHLDKYCPHHQLEPNESNQSRFVLTSQKEIEAYMSGQLCLFPKECRNTNVKWNRDKIEFIELFYTIHECRAVTDTNGRPVTKKAFMELAMWFFNLQIGHWPGSLSAAKERKVKKDSPFLKELAETFTSLIDKKI